MGGVPWLEIEDVIVTPGSILTIIILISIFSGLAELVLGGIAGLLGFFLNSLFLY